MDQYEERLSAIKQMTVELIETCSSVELLEYVWKLIADTEASE